MPIPSRRILVGLVALCALFPGQALGPRQSSGSGDSPTLDRVPILMYHVVDRPPTTAPYPRLYVSRREFADQMRWLAGRGYVAVTLRQAFDSWEAGTPLPWRSIVISFDDGYRSQFTHALPVLRARGWPGVLNLDLSNLTGTWDLSSRMVRRMIAAGWEIDAHSLTHPDLRHLGGAALRREVAGSRAAIRSRFDVPADFFCYPSGRYDDEVLAAVRAAGFRGATTTEFGLADGAEPFRLARVRIDGGDGVRGLQQKLASLGVVDGDAAW